MLEWSTACPDWERRIVAGEALVPPPLFPDEAERALSVFGELRMVDAVGSPLMRETVRPWVTDFVGSIFGAYDATTGRRQINEFLLLISKKNGKSTIAAGIMLTALILNWRSSGEFIILAPTKEVADNSFGPIRDMVNADEELSALFNVQEHLRKVTHRGNGGTLKVVAADSDTVSGKKAIGVFVDELWLFGKNPKAEAMLREATGGLVSRPEGFVIYATTHADDAPAGVWLQKLHYARKVRDGVVKNPRFLPVLYEFPQAMLDAKEHRDFKNAYITNPNFGLSVDEQFLSEKFDQAREQGEESFVGFLAKHLNVEIGLALRSDRWPGADFWEAAGSRMTLDEFLAKVEVVDVGIDGGGLDDLLGLALVGREAGSARWHAWMHAWAHPSVLERRKAEAARFGDFARDGDLTLVQRLGDDVAEVADIVERVHAAGLLDKVGVDVAGIGAIVEAIEARGVDREEYIVGVSQGWRLAGAIKTTERRLAGGELLHDGSALMAWCVSNAKVEPRANSLLITKQASGSAKIDPLMALFNAVTLLSLNPEGALNQGCVVL